MRNDWVLTRLLHRCSDILEWSGSLVTGGSAIATSPLGTPLVDEIVLEQPTEPRPLTFVEELFKFLYSFLHLLTGLPFGL